MSRKLVFSSSWSLVKQAMSFWDEEEQEDWYEDAEWN